MSADNTKLSSLITCVVTTLRGISIPISWGQFFLFQVNVFFFPLQLSVFTRQKKFLNINASHSLGADNNDEELKTFMGS